MSPRAIEEALVAELRKLPVGQKAVAGEIRVAIGCTGAELKAAIGKLRMQGKLVWDRLELAASMRIDAPVQEEEQEQNSAADLPPEQAAEGSGEGPEDGGGGTDTPPPPSPAPIEPEAPAPIAEPVAATIERPTGEELHDEVLAYLARTRTPKIRMLDLIGGNARLFEIKRTLLPRPATVERIRGIIAANPDGIPVRPLNPPGAIARKDESERIATRAAREAIVAEAPPPDAPIAEQVKHEAEVLGARRRLAGSISSGSRDLATAAPLTVAEQVQSEIAAEPVDLMRAINRRHPLLWKRVLELGRSRGDRMPSIALYDVIEAGLEQLERKGAKAA